MLSFREYVEKRMLTEKKLCAKGKAWAKRTYDVYPSAYANLAASAYCSGKIKPKKKGKKDNMNEDLRKWVDENWVDIGRPKKGGGYESCGRKDADKGKYPKCVPAAKAARMSKSQKKSAVRRKRRHGAGPGKGGKPQNVPTFKKS